MPELPEVESVRLGVHEWTAGATITGAEVLDPRILGTTSQRRIDASAADGFVTAVTGRRIIGAERRGKFMWLTLRSGDTLPRFSDTTIENSTAGSPGLSLLVHLGMSGQLRVHSPGDEVHRHTRVILRLVRGTERYELRFVDQRIFGHIGVQPLVPAHKRLVPATASHIAADPLEPGYESALVLNQLGRKRTVLKSALLDQTLISGIGNIYADEALFRAGIHPLAIPARTRRGRLAAVLESAVQVMNDALFVGGTSFDALYVNVNGESGYFSRSLEIYARHGQPCNRCGTTIVREKIGGRSSHFCPSCQRKR